MSLSGPGPGCRQALGVWTPGREGGSETSFPGWGNRVRDETEIFPMPHRDSTDMSCCLACGGFPPAPPSRAPPMPSPQLCAAADPEASVPLPLHSLPLTHVEGLESPRRDTETVWPAVGGRDHEGTGWPCPGKGRPASRGDLSLALGRMWPQTSLQGSLPFSSFFLQWLTPPGLPPPGSPR